MCTASEKAARKKKCVAVWAVVGGVCVCVWLCGLCRCVAVWLCVDGSISLEFVDEDPTVVAIATFGFETSI